MVQVFREHRFRDGVDPGVLPTFGTAAMPLSDARLIAEQIEELLAQLRHDKRVSDKFVANAQELFEFMQYLEVSTPSASGGKMGVLVNHQQKVNSHSFWGFCRHRMSGRRSAGDPGSDRGERLAIVPTEILRFSRTASFAPSSWCNDLLTLPRRWHVDIRTWYDSLPCSLQAATAGASELIPTLLAKVSAASISFNTDDLREYLMAQLVAPEGLEGCCKAPIDPGITADIMEYVLAATGLHPEDAAV